MSRLLFIVLIAIFLVTTVGVNTGMAWPKYPDEFVDENFGEICWSAVHAKDGFAHEWHIGVYYEEGDFVDWRSNYKCTQSHWSTKAKEPYWGTEGIWENYWTAEIPSTQYNYDKEEDDPLTLNDMATITSIKDTHRTVSDTTEIQYCTNLKYLEFDNLDTTLESLDITGFNDSIKVFQVTRGNLNSLTLPNSFGTLQVFKLDMMDLTNRIDESVFENVNKYYLAVNGNQGSLDFSNFTDAIEIKVRGGGTGVSSFGPLVMPNSNNNLKLFRFEPYDSPDGSMAHLEHYHFDLTVYPNLEKFYLAEVGCDEVTVDINQNFGWLYMLFNKAKLNVNITDAWNDNPAEDCYDYLAELIYNTGGIDLTMNNCGGENAEIWRDFSRRTDRPYIHLYDNEGDLNVELTNCNYFYELMYFYNSINTEEPSWDYAVESYEGLNLNLDVNIFDSVYIGFPEWRDTVELNEGNYIDLSAIGTVKDNFTLIESDLYDLVGVIMDLNYNLYFDTGTNSAGSSPFWDLGSNKILFENRKKMFETLRNSDNYTENWHWGKNDKQWQNRTDIGLPWLSPSRVYMIRVDDDQYDPEEEYTYEELKNMAVPGAKVTMEMDMPEGYSDNISAYTIDRTTDHAEYYIYGNNNYGKGWLVFEGLDVKAYDYLAEHQDYPDVDKNYVVEAADTDYEYVIFYVGKFQIHGQSHIFIRSPYNVFVKTNGVWQPADVFAKDDGFKPSAVYVKTEGQWQLIQE